MLCIISVVSMAQVCHWVALLGLQLLLDVQEGAYGGQWSWRLRERWLLSGVGCVCLGFMGTGHKVGLVL